MKTSVRFTIYKPGSIYPVASEVQQHRLGGFADIQSAARKLLAEKVASKVYYECENKGGHFLDTGWVEAWYCVKIKKWKNILDLAAKIDSIPPMTNFE